MSSTLTAVCVGPVFTYRLAALLADETTIQGAAEPGSGNKNFQDSSKPWT
jgi:hypothetical protein